MIPRNEQETIALFVQHAQDLGYQFERMGTRCPDAILSQNGNKVRVEFEHKARNFEKHKHPVDKVDIIICWEDDWEQSPLPVLSLEKYITLAKPPEQLPKWRRFLLWLRDIRFVWIQCQIEIQERRKLKRTRRYCKACGKLMRVASNQDSEETKKAFWSERYYFNIYTYFTCGCGYCVTETSRQYLD